MITDIINIVSTVFGWIGEKSKAKHERSMAAIELEKRLLLSKTEANTRWEIAQLNDKDKLLRWCAFVLFASPLISSFISPELHALVNEGWNSLKPWQSNVLSGICLSVFGFKKIPEIFGATVGSVVQAIKRK